MREVDKLPVMYQELKLAFRREAASFNQSAAANSRRAFRLRVAGDLVITPALHRRSPAAVAELGR